MRRRQLFEFEDFRWFPRVIRDYMTDYLSQVLERYRIFEPTIPVLAALLDRTGHRHVVDFGSGGGGAWRAIAPRLREKVRGLTITLTDLYPNARALHGLEASCPSLFRFDRRTVDAVQVPPGLPGVRTQFLSLHHFEPDAVQRIFRSAVEAGQPIAVFEAQRRDLSHLLRFALSPVTVFMLTPRIRPFRLGRLLLTYLFPVVPFFILWDGLVSVLRTYEIDEMMALASRADRTRKFRWESGELQSEQASILYLLGWPSKGEGVGPGGPSDTQGSCRSWPPPPRLGNSSV